MYCSRFFFFFWLYISYILMNLSNAFFIVIQYYEVLLTSVTLYVASRLNVNVDSSLLDVSCVIVILLCLSFYLHFSEREKKICKTS